MVTFDSAQPGTPASEWGADPRWGSGTILDPRTFAEVFVVAAHPDDETLGAGGLIAECGLQGVPVTVVVVTDGGSSHPDSPTTTPTELAKKRAAEVTLAVTGLNPAARVIRLGFTDGEVRSHRERIAGELGGYLPATATGTVVLVTTWRGDEHPDHEIIGEICAGIADTRGYLLAEYPIWMWHWATPSDAAVPWDRFSRLALTPTAASLKAAAIADHGSQVSPLSDEPGDEALLRPDFLEHFTGTQEIFIVDSVPASRQRGMEPGYFDDLYERFDDPWKFTERWYEKRKRALTLASLPAERYSTALEIGCSIGVLTEQLAARVDSLLAVDVSEAAVARARQRVSTAGTGATVRVEQLDIGEDFPGGQFDLIVLSEVGYYFDTAGLHSLLDQVDAHLGDHGTLVLCHWRHPVADYPLRGDDVHEAVAGRATLVRVASHVEEDFRLEVYTRDGASVAQQGGLVP